MKLADHTHGGDIYSCREEFPALAVQDFSANINPLGLPEGVRRALENCADACTHYPDPHCRALRAAIARFEDVPADWVLCTNGAADLISRIAWGLRPKTALLLAPTFAEYERTLAAAGCRVHRHPLRAENGFALDASILGAIKGMELVFLCNPNNPTGRLADPALLEAVLDACRAAGAVLAVDECFLDFVPEAEHHTLKRRLAGAEHLLVVRAFTKIFAMPGLRLGYGICSSPALLARIAQGGAEWAVSVPAQLCGVAAVQETAYLAQTVRSVPLWREQLAAGLTALGCEVFPSSTNFLLLRARPDLAALLRPRGVLLRDCANFPGLSRGYFRTAVRTAEQNSALLDTMRAVL